MAKEYLRELKYKVLQELPEFKGIQNEQDYQNKLDHFKYEVAGEVGIPLKQGYNGDLTSHQAGIIGGHIGGKIGGNMVRKMIKAYESSVKNSGV